MKSLYQTLLVIVWTGVLVMSLFVSYLREPTQAPQYGPANDQTVLRLRDRLPVVLPN